MARFCWVNPTFTITENGNQVRVLSPSYPGVVKAIGSAAQAAGGGGGADGGRPEERRYYYYYQWVSITLLVQVVFFYLPYLLWKCVEKGRIQFLTKGIWGDVNYKGMVQNYCGVFALNSMYKSRSSFAPI